METQRINHTPPLSWRPERPQEIIGKPAQVAAKLLAKAKRARENGRAPLKILLYGPPGIGKTTIADMVAAQLDETRWGVDETNGKLVTIETVKRWMRELAFANLFSDWSVKIVNEMDRCSRDAQDLLLSYLDRLPPGRAFIGTSNLDLSQLTERFQTRFQAIRLEAPASEEIRGFLLRHWEVPEQTASMIAVGCGGNVRAALADLESYLDATS